MAPEKPGPKKIHVKTGGVPELNLRETATKTQSPHFCMPTQRQKLVLHAQNDLVLNARNERSRMNHQNECKQKASRPHATLPAKFR
eukprot:CAMPEP_0114266050 /NCGR_PEP_ID=MMETSP0058-20121206/24354_1 /TAXON_ID=36894 /ORGANISM="Pyramimonas parkeae, CCMP726" /LENGTH=85 /DNA_ID=CAMNT_0001383407 /DNA_START=151 /DNA_END=408 /DNA_ORIENTATION=-